MPILPHDVNCALHNEDVDLSGAAGAIAAALAGGNKGHELNGTDGIQFTNEIEYLGFVYADEGAVDADGNVTIGRKRAYEIPLELSDGSRVHEAIFPSGIKLATRENIAVTGRSSGAGAEQHSCIHYVRQPGLGENFQISNQNDDIIIRVAALTAALVAQTISGFTDICGRTVAYVGGQDAIPNNSQIKIQLHALTPFHSAGYSGIAIRTPKSSRQVLFMGNGGAATIGTTAGSIPRRYDMHKIFGGALACDAQNPLQIGGWGVGTTAQWALLELGLSGVGRDG